MKKVLSLVLGLVLLVGMADSCIIVDEQRPVIKSKVSGWAEEEMSRAFLLDWVDFWEDYTMNIKRGEFCRITENALRDMGLDVHFGAMITPFADLNDEKSETWSIKYLYCLGIVEGKSETLFCPDDLITREEAAVIFKRIIDAFREWNVIDITTDGVNDWAYTDHDSISEWAVDDVYAVSNLGIMKGTDKGFEPKKNLSIEGAVVMLIRLYDKCQITEADMSFADNLNKEMPKDKNYMFSPLSIKMALGLLVNGAEGETQAEILDVLGYESVDELNNLSKNLIEKYSLSDKIRFDVANSIWINKSNTEQRFSEEYKNVVNEYYNAEAMDVTNSNAVSEINSWVKEKTNGKITGITDNNEFWAMLVNAIYFKGMWDDEFYKGATKKGEFRNADGTKGEIDFMNKTDWIYYADTGESEIIELPYKTSFFYLDENGEEVIERNRDLSASMYIIMPKGEIDVESQLDKARDNYKRTYMKLSLPKFEVEYSAQMSNTLKEMGIKKAFAKDAEFSKMFDIGSMFLTDIIHKTYIKVDEEGTEAAAVTEIAFVGASIPPEPVEFKVDKPFYFAVKVDDEILFMGRYAYVE